MKTFILFASILVASLAAHAQGTAFTYQGRLQNNGVPANGAYDLQFSLRDAAVGGNPVGGTNSIAPVAVSNGLFTVTLDFGAGIFTGGERWLEIGVKSNGVAGAHTPLTPLQRLTPSPYAIFAGGAQTATTVATGGVSSGSLAVGAVNSSAIADSSIQSGDLSAPLLDGTFWRLNGNAGTTPGVNSLGTADNQALEFKVNGTRALRLEPNAGGTPNVIGGSPINSVGAGWVGATIGGGGSASYALTNRVEGSWGTVSGGAGNTIQGNADSATIGGGYRNTIEYGAGVATIGGGNRNTIQHTAYHATIGGGFKNLIQPYANSATIPGGEENSATNYAFAAGRRAKANHTGAFIWADATDADFPSTGDNQFLIRAAGGVGLNKNNPATALDVNGVVTATGFSGNQALEFKVNDTRALRLEPNTGGAPNVIGGSSGNFAEPGIVGATIAGGGAVSYQGVPSINKVTADFGTVGVGAC